MSRLLNAALTLLLVTAPIAAAGQTLKLATLVPDGSVWEKELGRLGQKWTMETEGRVKLKIYPGGVAGDEPDVVRKMRIGQLQAATLTVSGLSLLDEGFNVFTIPVFFDSYDELFHVVDGLTPMLEKKLADKGWVLVHWGHAGWFHFFSKKPIQTLDDAKGMKMWASSTDADMVTWWQKNGFQPVALAPTDVLQGLETGMVQALPVTPLTGLSLQWYRHTPYMMDMGLLPLVGATVVSKKAWDSISETDRVALLAAAEETESRLERAIPRQDERAVNAMVKRGLTVTSPENEVQREAWVEAAQVFAASMEKDMVPGDVFGAAETLRDEFRAKASAQPEAVAEAAP